MSKEQQINQINYLKHHNQQACLLYYQQIITYLTVLNWLKAMYMVKESTIYNEKCTSEAEILSTESHQEIDDVKPLKHKEKPNLKTGLASESLYYQKDEDTGLYYANARYYDSNTGRFNREDPFDGDVQTPPSLHRYLYANANPNYYVDPTGKCSSIMNMMEPNACDRFIASLSDPEIAEQMSFERKMEAAALLGIGQAGVDAVTGTADLLGQLSATLGEGLSGGTLYKGSARQFRDTLSQTGNAIVNPIDTTVQAFEDYNKRVAELELAGDYFAAVKERYRFGTNVAATVFGLAKTAQSLSSNSAKIVVESSDNKTALRITETPELARKRAELAKINTSDFTTAQKGNLGELRTSLTLQKAGFTEQAARLPRNNGFDGVWFKVNSDGSINNIIITESKFSSSGKASLAQTRKMGQQLSTKWIDTNILKMLDSKDANVRKTGRMLQNNKGLIKTKAALIKPDGNQSFNNIKKPELDY